MGRRFSQYEAAFTLGVIVSRISVYSDEVHNHALFFFLIKVSSGQDELFVPTNKANIHKYKKYGVRHEARQSSVKRR